MAKNIKYRKNQTIGDWKLSYKLGSGGNGEVWSVKDGNDSYAIKLLKKSGRRFTIDLGPK